MKPKLRFKGFSDEYVLSDLGKYLIQYKKTTNSNNQYPVLTSSRSGIFFQEDYFNRQVASKDNTGYNIVPRNYFTYRHMSDDTIFSFNINTLCDYGIVSTLYPVFTTNTEMNSNYLKEYLNNSKRFSEYCLLQKQGGSRTYMYFDKLKKFVGCFPSIQEQTKVSNFLSLIDKKIDLQSKKIEDLKLFKLCIIKEIFESNNANTLTKIKDIAKIEKGKQINGELLLEQGNYYMLNGGINPSGYLNEYNRNENTITISEGGNSCGYVSYNKDKFWCGGHCYSVSPNDINNEYLYQLLKYNEKSIMNLRVGSGLPNIQKKDIENFCLNIHNNEEQENIATKLSKYDYKIELEEKYLIKLQELKKGLMQNMFV